MKSIESADLVRFALSRLKSRERLAIEDYFFRGLTYRQAGKLRGVCGCRFGQLLSLALWDCRIALRDEISLSALDFSRRDYRNRLPVQSCGTRWKDGR